LRNFSNNKKEKVFQNRKLFQESYPKRETLISIPYGLLALGERLQKSHNEIFLGKKFGT